MNDYPLVSVVIISYNQEEYIVECLESIFSQTYERIELIVSDDCSTDNTWQLIVQWELNHKERFETVIIHQNMENLGISGNLSNALRMAKGEYIKILGADDWLHPRAISQFTSFSVDSGAEWVVSDYIKIFEKNKAQQKIHPPKFYQWIFIQPPAAQLIQLLNYNYIAAPGVFMSCSLVKKYGYFEHGMKNLEDGPMWINLLNNGKSVKHLSEYLVYYRCHENSVSNSSKPEAKHNHFLNSIEYLNTFILPNIPKWAHLLRWHTEVKKIQIRLLINTNPKYTRIRSLYKFVFILDPIFIMQKFDSDKQHFNRYLISKYARRLERESKGRIVQ